MRNFLLVSVDSHAALDPADYAKWLEPEYRDEVENVIRHTKQYEKQMWPFACDAQSMALIDERGAISGGHKFGLWNADLRIAELDAEGIAAEIIFPGDVSSIGMYYNNLNTPYPADYRAAGSRAYNRWLADFCSNAPKRMIGVAQMEPWPGIDACVKEVEWARGAGLGVIGAPRYTGLEANQPMFTTREWDPFWKACVDNGFPVAFHIGNQRKQGVEMRIAQEDDRRVTGYPEWGTQIPYDPAHRPLWQLIMSGVFDRFPDLRITFTELASEWVAPTLAHLEARLDALRFGECDSPMPKLRPTDYWRRNCGVGGPMKPYEFALRHQTGIDTVMFGHDYPHPEGAWPNTHDWLRVCLQGIPEGEARMMLGENALRIYGLDEDFLRSRGWDDFTRYRCDPDHEPPRIYATAVPKVGRAPTSG